MSDEVVLLDVTPLDLAIKAADGTSLVMIPKNTVIPTSAVRTFTTRRNYQRSAQISVRSGSNSYAAFNMPLVDYLLEDIAPLPAGVPQIEVRFDLDNNSTLTVSAQNLTNGQIQSHTISSTGGRHNLDEDEGQRQWKEDIAQAEGPSPQGWDTWISFVKLKYECMWFLDSCSGLISSTYRDNVQQALDPLWPAGDEIDPEPLPDWIEQINHAMSEIFLELSRTDPADLLSTPLPKVQEELTGFEILDRISGGMGDVLILRAGDSHFAGKTLRRDRAENENAQERFRHEAQIWSSLPAHTNVASVLGIHDFAAGTIIISDFAPAGDLSKQLGQVGKLEAIDIAIQVAEGLCFAAEHGLVHRDVKPANILLWPDNSYPSKFRVKVSDFGIATIFKNENLSEVLGEESLDHTVGVGTPAYMAPEQFDLEEHPTQGFEPRQISTRSDIFAFGVTLYQLLSGALPFATPAARFKERLPDLEFEDNPGLRAILARCLPRAPEDRWPDFIGLIAALKETYQSLAGEAYPGQCGAIDEPAETILGRGLALLAAGDIEGAEALIEPLTAQDSASASTLTAMAHCKEAATQWDQAKALLQRATDLNSESFEAWMGMLRCAVRQGSLNNLPSLLDGAYRAYISSRLS